VFGLALVRLTFDDNGTDFQRRTLVTERLRDAELPDGVSVSIGTQATPVGQIYRYTLEGPRSLRELRAIQDFVVERRLRAVPGVADVVTFGGFERQFQVRIDPARLAATGVSVQEIYDAVSQANNSAGGGYVRIGAQEFVVRGLGTALDPSDLGLAVVRETDGVPIRVRDVADIVEGSTPRRGAVGRGHRDEVIEGIVLLRRGENPSVVLDALRERIHTLNDSVLPDDVQLVTFYDRASLVSATLHTVGHNLLEGFLFVLLVVYVFLRSFRALIILAIVIPVSMLTAFVGIHAMGLPANLISLGAIDFGILVDGAVIVVEATLHELHLPRLMGETKDDVIERAVLVVARPVAFSMLIIIVALGPIFTLERVEGRIFAPMAFTYAFALLGALMCAMFVVPALEGALMNDHSASGEPRWLAFLGDHYRSLLGRLRRFRWVLAAIVLGGATGLGTYAAGIGTEFLPELNEGGFYITAIFPSTISLDETRIRAGEVRERLLAIDEVIDVLSHVGRPEHATQAEGPNNIEFFVSLAPEAQWGEGVTRESLERRMRSSLGEIPGVQYNFSQPITDRVFETISGIIGQVVVKVHGTDLEEMSQVADDVRGALSHVDGVTDLALYQAGEVPQLRIEVDREALARRGLSVADVEQTIGIALGGAVATELWQAERRYDVALRLPESVRSDPEALGRLTVGDPERQITLGEVTHIELARGRGAIWREDFARFLAVKFNVRGRDLGSTVAEGQRVVEALGRHDGIYITWSGEFENQARALRRLGFTLPVALFGIMAVLYISFRRARPTLMILAFLPLAVVAAVAGLRLAGENFSVSGAVGCIALLGQIVLAGVMLCSRIDEAREHDEDDPLLAGARVAFRPVLLATALALFGLIPAATSHAMGSETQRPFAIAIVGGLLIATPAVLILLPLIYAGAMKPRSPTNPRLTMSPPQNSHLDEDALDAFPREGDEEETP
jgi:cobalt-zinc-cadmium resistance protein CzcA